MGDSDGSQNSNNETAVEANDQKFIPIPLANFMSGQNTPADIYIKLTSGKFICIARKGQPFSLDRLTKYREHNVTHLYFDSNQYGDYVEKYLDISKLVAANFKVSPQQKTKILTRAGESVISELSQKKFDKSAFTHAQAVSESMMSICADKPALNGVIKQIENLSEDFAKHCLAVSMISIVLAQKMGWNGEKSLQSLALAGLLHDIGMKEVPQEILTKRRSEWTREETHLYESHPDRGRDILMSLPEIPLEIITIVHQHHEMPGQRGFPQKMSRDRIFPLSRVVCLADLFAHAIIKTKLTPAPMTCEEAYQYLHTLHGSGFDGALWNALKRCFDAKADKIAA